MKFIVEITVEIAMIVATAYENQNNYIIMNFSAFTIVSFTDQFFMALIHDKLKAKMEESDKQLPILNSEIKW